MTVSRKFYPLKGGDISAVHYGDSARPADMVFLHATGFNALAYKTLLEPFCKAEGLHTIALDLRGHGMSRLPADPAMLSNWNILRDDVLAFLDAYIEAPVILAGHSLGAGVSLMTAAKGSDKIRGVVALDPVTVPALARLIMATRGGRAYSKKRFSLARNAGKRRALFDSKQAVFERYHGRGTFKHTPDAVLRDYIDGGFVDSDAGAALTCKPEWEQAIFVAQSQNIFKAAKSSPQNTQIIYAVKGSPTTAGTRAKMRRIIGTDKVQTLKDKRHFFPLETPELARGFLKKALDF